MTNDAYFIPGMREYGVSLTFFSASLYINLNLAPTLTSRASSPNWKYGPETGWAFHF